MQCTEHLIGGHGITLPETQRSFCSFLPWDSRTQSTEREKIWRLPTLPSILFWDFGKAVILLHICTRLAQGLTTHLMTRTWENVLFEWMGEMGNGY